MNEVNRKIIIPDFMIFLKYVKEKPSITLSELQYETDITHAHLTDLKKIIIGRGWVRIEQEGLKQKMFLTDVGSELAKRTVEMFELMKIADKDIFSYRRKHTAKKFVKDKPKETPKEEVKRVISESFEGIKQEAEDENKDTY